MIMISCSCCSECFSLGNRSNINIFYSIRVCACMCKHFEHWLKCSSVWHSEIVVFAFPGYWIRFQGIHPAWNTYNQLKDVWEDVSTIWSYLVRRSCVFATWICVHKIFLISMPWLLLVLLVDIFFCC